LFISLTQGDGALHARLTGWQQRRGRLQPEYELMGTGAFDDGRYWITEVHYAKAGPDDLLMQISVMNAGPEDQTGWTVLIADVIRRRHGDVHTAGDILRLFGGRPQR
jgi:hypothetical protein